MEGMISSWTFQTLKIQQSSIMNIWINCMNIFQHFMHGRIETILALDGL